METKAGQPGPRLQPSTPTFRLNAPGLSACPEPCDSYDADRELTVWGQHTTRYIGVSKASAECIRIQNVWDNGVSKGNKSTSPLDNAANFVRDGLLILDDEMRGLVGREVGDASSPARCNRVHEDETIHALLQGGRWQSG